MVHLDITKWIFGQDHYARQNAPVLHTSQGNAMTLSTREANRRMLLEHLGAENQHRRDATLATLTPGCVFEDVALQRCFHGHAGAAEYYGMWWSAFGMRVERGGESHWVSDDLYVSEAVYQGKHVGEFLGIAPTHRPVRLRFVVFASFENGRLSGERFYYDLASLLRQIGVETLPRAHAPAGTVS